MEQGLIEKNFFVFHARNFLVNKQTTILPLLFLLITFLGIVSWFESVDFYHRYFYQKGLIVTLYNCFRICFTLYLFWLICAAGFLIGQCFKLKAYKLTFTERLVIEFCIGVGGWHLILFILGMLNLYYRSVMVLLCLSILTLSINRFNECIHDIKIIIRSKKDIYSTPILNKINFISIGVALFCLLLVRGLYPGGGGDYFTHYFYYYTEVIRNHGLMPNDVWYHYYYSKGAGLAFLGILLTDFEAPQIATFCCVAAASLAIMSLTKRMISHSLWPIFSTLLYVFYCLLSPATMLSGEFQKTHEETSALIILLIWAICMYSMRPKKWFNLFFITMISVVLASVIITQAAAIFMASVVGVFFCIALYQQNIKKIYVYGFTTMTACLGVVIIFLLNYYVTGLATDQAIKLMWRFANVEKLNQWGVIPNVFLVAWIRDNYIDVLTKPLWSLFTFEQLVNFMRLKELWCLIVASFSSFFLMFFLSYLKNKPIKSHSFRFAINSFMIISLSIIVFAILSIIVGRDQSVSFFRFCSFFVPLIILFCLNSWALFINKYKQMFSANIFTIQIPILLTIFVLFSHSWPIFLWGDKPHKIIHLTKDSIRFMKGRFSLAKAYSHQHQGLKFGGINPDVREAVKHIPFGARIWSTNVDSYCMIPNCKIESVISFKLSSRLNEILNGSPDLAKKILQEEGLNYFLFSSQSQLIDLLIYSKLFHPAVMDKFFSIKWSNGKTYLLTWKNTKLRSLDADFFAQYTSRLKEPESSWFRFSEAIPKMNLVMNKLAKSSHPWQPENFPSPLDL